MWCSPVRPKAPVAVASAAASTISASATVKRPCSMPPTAHKPAVSAASHTALWASGKVSECQRKNATPASSSTNCSPPNHNTERGTGGW